MIIKLDVQCRSAEYQLSLQFLTALSGSRVCQLLWIYPIRIPYIHHNLGEHAAGQLLRRRGNPPLHFWATAIRQ